MIAYLYEQLYKRLKELTWMKHIAMDYNQVSNPSASSTWNTPAVFISFQTYDISQLSNSIYQTTTDINIKFVMKDFSTNQLITLKYVEMLKKKLNGFLGLFLVNYNYYIDQDVNYQMDIVFRLTYREDLTNPEENIEGILEQINLGLQEVEDFDDETPEGFAKNGVDISPTV